MGEALCAWKDGLMKCSDQKGHNVWILSPSQVVSCIKIKDIYSIKELMWASTKAEMNDYFKWCLHPNDCDNRVLQTTDRYVYMTWKALDQSMQKNINIPASRILMENMMISPPMISRLTDDLTVYTHCFPSDHVVFHMTDINGQLVNYSKKQFMIDWKYMFPEDSIPAYRKLADTRYKHASQALLEYENTGQLNDLVKAIIVEYMGKKVGPCSHWDHAQLAVLGAAMVHMYRRNWDMSHITPRVLRLNLK
jgi:hypothetical protein